MDLVGARLPFGPTRDPLDADGASLSTGPAGSDWCLCTRCQAVIVDDVWISPDLARSPGRSTPGTHHAVSAVVLPGDPTHPPRVDPNSGTPSELGESTRE